MKRDPIRRGDEEATGGVRGEVRTRSGCHIRRHPETAEHEGEEAGELSTSETEAQSRISREEPGSRITSMSCIAVEVFRSLRRALFSHDGSPLSFELPPKGNSQDDPLDRFLARDVLTLIPGLTVVEAPGPLTTPDLVAYIARAASMAHRARPKSPTHPR